MLLAGCWALLEIVGLALARPVPYGPPSLIMIYSAPGHFERRLAIRRTWCSAASLRPSGSRCLFLLGRAGPEAKLEQVRQKSAGLPVPFPSPRECSPLCVFDRKTSCSPTW